MVFLNLRGGFWLIVGRCSFVYGHEYFYFIFYGDGWVRGPALRIVLFLLSFLYDSFLVYHGFLIS